jgi:Ca2+/H+ antiporter
MDAKIFWSKKTKDQREQPKSAKATHGRGWSTLVLMIITLVKKCRLGLLLNN